MVARRRIRPRPRPARTSPKIVVCVTGMPAAGKEEIVKVARRLGFSIVRMGDVVRDEARALGLASTDHAIGGMAHQERVEHGFGIWAERTLPRVPGGRVLIDGLRGRAELDVYRRAFGERLVVLAVHASPGTRFGRVVRRDRSDTTASREAFVARDERELGWGLGDTIATAEVLLVNEGTLAELRRAVRDVLEHLDG